MSNLTSDQLLKLGAKIDKEVQSLVAWAVVQSELKEGDLDDFIPVLLLDLMGEKPERYPLTKRVLESTLEKTPSLLKEKIVSILSDMEEVRSNVI